MPRDYLAKRGWGARLSSSFMVCVGLGITTVAGWSQSALPSEGTPSIQDYFESLATAPGVGGRRGEKDYIKLTDAIPTMSRSEILAGLTIIDRQIDNHSSSSDALARANAAFFLYFISARQDALDFLAPEIPRLTYMLNDPSHSLTAPALMTLMNFGVHQRMKGQKDSAIPIIEEALKAPEVNNSTGIGPGIVSVLFLMAGDDESAMIDVAKYMRRPDITDRILIDTILAINAERPISDVLASELVLCLDRPDDRVKTRALIGIALSSQRAQVLARTRIQRMSSDTAESQHVRRIAAEALDGRVIEGPDERRVEGPPQSYVNPITGGVVKPPPGLE